MLENTPTEKIEEIKRMLDDGETITAIVKKVHVSNETVNLIIMDYPGKQKPVKERNFGFWDKAEEWEMVTAGLLGKIPMEEALPYFRKA